MFFIKIKKYFTTNKNRNFNELYLRKLIVKIVHLPHEEINANFHNALYV